MLERLSKNRKLNDIVFTLWAGLAALLTYSMIYALRKPYTAASFEGMTFFGMDYKSAATTIQILGYLIAKFVGIKLISELKRERRFKFFVWSVVAATLSLVAFALIPAPYNVVGLFCNGLTLGCMWGVIFSYIEGRRMTDILASFLGISIVFSSGFAKSMGLWVMNDLGVDQFWMPCVIGLFALPLLILLGYILKSLPNPSDRDMQIRSERVAIDGRERWQIFRRFMPFLTLVFVANFFLLVLRDIKEDFLVNIFDMTGHSSWLFAQLDTVVTLIILTLFGLMVIFRSNIRAMVVLVSLVTLSTICMSYISLSYESLQLEPVTWLFIQSLSLYIPYLAFQSIFFDRFIATFKIKGNVGYFIALIDFIGYAGTVLVLTLKELLKIDTDWYVLYNNLAAFVGILCTGLTSASLVLLVRKYRSYKRGEFSMIEDPITKTTHPSRTEQPTSHQVETSCI